MQFDDDTGSASLEFIAFGVIASLGIMFATLELQALQNRQFVAQQFSKQIARSLVSNADRDRLSILLENLRGSYQLAEQDVTFSVSCQPQCVSVDSIEPGSVIEVSASFEGQTSVTRMRSAR